MLPAGKYYIGDPCYVIAEENWDAWLDAYREGDGELTYNGHEMWAHQTYFGDGSYKDQQGREYGVDAGTLAAVPFDLVERSFGSLGHVIDFDKPFECSCDEGVFTFGNIVIDTYGHAEDEDMHDDYDMYDDDESEDRI